MKNAYRTRLASGFARAACASLLLAFAANSQAQQICPATSPAMDVLLFLDNSSSINSTEFDGAQAAVAQIATSLLSRPGYRLSVVNWACSGAQEGCRIDLATGSAIPGGWSSNPADFAYAGPNSSGNRVCRSFGLSSNTNMCGGGAFTQIVAADFAQHALKMLDAAWYSGGGTGGTDSAGAPTVAPGAPTQRLMLIHMTDAFALNSSLISEMPFGEAGLGLYYYSNRFKNVRNALVVGVGIAETNSNAIARAQLGAFSSRGGSSTDYDTAHATAASTAAADVGTPRLATFSATFDASAIVAAATSALDAAIPACLTVRKQSNAGIGSFTFTGGTNGLPAMTLTTTATTNPASQTAVLSTFLADTSIQETIPAGWTLSSIACVDKNNVAVPVTTNTSTGQLTIPGARVVSGERFTCTFTNLARVTDLLIQKTATPNPVPANGLVQFTVTVTNNGPTAASGATVNDPAVAGLDCTAAGLPAPTCTATSGAACPSPLTVAGLQAGLAIPTLPNTGTVTLGLTCRVTASGF